MGVWARKTRLKYSIYPLYNPSLDKTLISEKARRSTAYQKAQELREKLQLNINQLLS